MQKYLFLFFTLILSSCGGDSSNSVPIQPLTPPPPTQAELSASARFLNQATFGANIIMIEKVASIGLSNWLDEQIALPTSSHVNYLTELEPTLNLPDDEKLEREHRLEAWFNHSITAQDQLRQRVAFALSEIFVVSEVSIFGDDTYGLANYYDLLLNNAFGNYRDLLEQVTLSPIMGMYLSMLGNEKPNELRNIRPDENYAREIMQLFSIGLVELNNDGTEVKLNGNNIPTYDQNIIKAFAHVFTGWNFNSATEVTWAQFYSNYDSINPMIAIPAFHDSGEKTLFNNVIVPADQTPEEDLKMALDNLFNHQNVGPFIGKQLIKKLVTSNPSSAYVERVASVFNNNGNGIRGDLSAVIKAIFLDEEAINGLTNDINNTPQTFGKIREPILRAVHLWRAFLASSPNDRFQFDWPEYFFAQAPLSAPHVFNFFSPNYAPPGIVTENNIIAPELEIVTENYLTRTSNFFAYSTLWGHTEFENENTKDDRILIDLSPLRPMAEDIDKLLDYLDMLLLGGSMGDEMRSILKVAYQDISDEEVNVRLSNLVFMIMVSPQYTVQK